MPSDGPAGVRLECRHRVWATTHPSGNRWYWTRVKGKAVLLAYTPARTLASQDVVWADVEVAAMFERMGYTEFRALEAAPREWLVDPPVT